MICCNAFIRKKAFPTLCSLKRQKQGHTPFLSYRTRNVKQMREYFSWGQKDKLARRRNLLAPWSLFVRQNIHSTRGIDDDVDDVDDEYGHEFDLDENNESVQRITTSVNH